MVNIEVVSLVQSRIVDFIAYVKLLTSRVIINFPTKHPILIESIATHVTMEGVMKTPLLSKSPSMQ